MGDVLRTLWKLVQRRDLSAFAAAMAYNLIFAVAPLLFLSGTLLAWLHLPGIEDWFRGPLGVLLSPALRRLLLQLAKGRHRPTLLSLAGLGVLWGLAGAMRQLIDALNRVEGIHHPRRPGWLDYVIAAAAGLIAGGLLTVSEALVVFGSMVVHLISILTESAPIWVWGAQVMRWALVIVLTGAVIAAIYAWLPDRRQPLRWVSPGQLTALVLWLGISWAFSLYTKALWQGEVRVYGGLAGVIFFVLYLYWLSWALLLGAQINQVIAAKDGSPRLSKGRPTRRQSRR